MGDSGRCGALAAHRDSGSSPTVRGKRATRPGAHCFGVGRQGSPPARRKGQPAVAAGQQQQLLAGGSASLPEVGPISAGKPQRKARSTTSSGSRHHRMAQSVSSSSSAGDAASRWKKSLWGGRGAEGSVPEGGCCPTARSGRRGRRAGASAWRGPPASSAVRAGSSSSSRLPHRTAPSRQLDPTRGCCCCFCFLLLLAAAAAAAVAADPPPRERAGRPGARWRRRIGSSPAGPLGQQHRAHHHHHHVAPAAASKQGLELPKHDDDPLTPH